MAVFTVRIISSVRDTLKVTCVDEHYAINGTCFGVACKPGTDSDSSGKIVIRDVGGRKLKERNKCRNDLLNSLKSQTSLMPR